MEQDRAHWIAQKIQDIHPCYFPEDNPSRFAAERKKIRQQLSEVKWETRGSQGRLGMASDQLPYTRLYRCLDRRKFVEPWLAEAVRLLYPGGQYPAYLRDTFKNKGWDPDMVHLPGIPEWIRKFDTQVINLADDDEYSGDTDGPKVKREPTDDTDSDATVAKVRRVKIKQEPETIQRGKIHKLLPTGKNADRNVHKHMRYTSDRRARKLSTRRDRHYLGHTATIVKREPEEKPRSPRTCPTRANIRITPRPEVPPLTLSQTPGSSSTSLLNASASYLRRFQPATPRPGSPLMQRNSPIIKRESSPSASSAYDDMRETPFDNATVERMPCIWNPFRNRMPLRRTSIKEEEWDLI